LKVKAATLPDSAATSVDKAAALGVKMPAFRIKVDALHARAAVMRDEPDRRIEKRREPGGFHLKQALLAAVMSELHSRVLDLAA
jgi:hypothetical protein